MSRGKHVKPLMSHLSMLGPMDGVSGSGELISASLAHHSSALGPGHRGAARGDCAKILKIQSLLPA